jgi:hypothetical protein
MRRLKKPPSQAKDIGLLLKLALELRRDQRQTNVRRCRPDESNTATCPLRKY